MAGAGASGSSRKSLASSGRWRISFSIDVVETDAFPGKLAYGPIPRSAGDVQAIADWSAGLVISLVTSADMTKRDAADLPDWIAGAGLAWLHLPIEDYHAPDATFEAAWREQGPRVTALLRDGGNVFVHCAAGLGRSGTVVARILLEAGLTLEAAISLTRATRPGAIETESQEAYLTDIVDKLI